MSETVSYRNELFGKELKNVSLIENTLAVGSFVKRGTSDSSEVEAIAKEVALEGD